VKEKMSKRTRRSYEQGAKEIRQATIRIKNGKPRIVDKTRKLSIAAVAEEAGMSEANIRNNYPEEADKIRGEKKKDLKQQRDLKQQQVVELRERLKEAHEEIADLNRRLQVVTSRNATLEGLVEALRKGTEKSNVASFPSQ
tara:strand:- start:22 stop:444 length:423 start_codon:yes stop_codon:yes gene_type:complete